jgi:hypothetical protein
MSRKDKPYANPSLPTNSPSHPTSECVFESLHPWKSPPVPHLPSPTPEILNKTSIPQPLTTV